MRIFSRDPKKGPDDGHAGELRDKGFTIDEVSRSVPIIGVRCVHEARDLQITAHGRVGIIVRCKKCGRTGPFMPVPERPLSSAETDLMVALAREAAWSGRVA